MDALSPTGAIYETCAMKYESPCGWCRKPRLSTVADVFSPTGSLCEGCEACWKRLYGERQMIPTGQLNGDVAARSRMMLADECQRLRDENTQLLAENARLRRKLEK